MKNDYKRSIFFFLVCFPLLLLCLIWPSLPKNIPMHIGFSGQIDSWFSKKYAFAILMVYELLLLFIWRFRDNRNDEHMRETKMLSILFYSLISLYILIIYKNPEGAEEVFSGFNTSLDLYLIIISFIYLVLGIYGNEIKQNFLIGIRTRKTLTDQRVWSNIHSQMQWVFLVVSVVHLILSLFACKYEIVLFLSTISILISLIIGIILLHRMEGGE